MNAPDYDQAARNVAYMAYMIGNEGLDPKNIDRLGFHVIAPEGQIDARVFGELVTKESIHRKVAARVAQYHGAWDAWFREFFELVLNQTQLSVLSWESILRALPEDEDETAIRGFYNCCLRYEMPRDEHAT